MAVSVGPASFTAFVTATALLIGWDASAQNLPPFSDSCLEANIDRYLWVRDLPAGDRTGDAQTLRVRAEQVYTTSKKPLTGAVGAWDRGLVPVWPAQQDAFQEAILNLHIPEIQTVAEVRKYLEANQPTVKSGYLNAIRHEFVTSPRYSNQQRANMLQPRLVENITKDLRDPRIVQKLEVLLEGLVEDVSNRPKLFYACSKLSWWNGGACSEAVAKLIDEQRWSGANLLFPQIWQEAFQNPIFAEGLRLLALKMLDRVQGEVAPGEVFVDAVSSFSAAGADASAAIELAWKAMALYGNGGQNTGARALTYDLNAAQTITGASLSIIGAATTLIDFKQRLQGARHYALPDAVGGTCLSPKPYHFWMAAFQSRRLLQLGIKRKPAAYASMTTAKLYQVKRHMSGVKNGGIERIFIKPGHHPTMRVIRMDLTLNAAGALYGAGLLKSNVDIGRLVTEYDVHSAQVEAVDLAKARKLAADDKKAFDHWERILSPEFVFERLLGK